MAAKNQVHFQLQDNCLGWKIQTVTGGQTFGLALGLNTDGSKFYHNFLWEIPAEKMRNVKEFLEIVANNKQADDDKRIHRGRMAVHKIKVKPDLEARFQHILSQLTPTTPKIQKANP